MKCSTRDFICCISLMDRHVSSSYRFYCVIISLIFLIYSISVLGISLFQVLTVISFPVAVAKAGSSILQAYIAAQNISIIDQNERKAKRSLDAAKKPE